MNFVTLDDLLCSFQPSFSSCEIRTFVMLHDNSLVNLVTSMLFSSKPVDQKISGNIDRVESAFSTGKIRFLYKRVKYEDAYSILQDIHAKGAITLRPYYVEFHQFNDLELQVSQSPRKMKEDSRWNIFYCEHRRKQTEQSPWSLLESQCGKSVNLGYSDTYDLIKNILEIDDYRSGDERDFVVQVPVYARIVELTPEKVKVKMHHAIDNLRINLFLRRTNYEYGTIDRQQVRVEKCKFADEEPFCYFEGNFSFQEVIKPHDSIDGSLFKAEISALILDRNWVTVPLENTVEPYAKTLFKFYPYDVLREHLYEPEKFKKSEDVFQDAVIRLLSLVGLPTAVQGNREYVKGKEKKEKYEVTYSESGVPIGSADIITYIENEKILLIDCTIEIPDDKKINRLDNLVKYFSFIKDEKGYPRISSLIFTPKDCGHIQIPHNLDVRIIDKPQIENLLNLALQGKIGNARRSLSY